MLQDQPMRFPRMQFSVRRLMVAVVIVGSVLGILSERRARFLEIAERHKFSPSDPAFSYFPCGGLLLEMAYHENMVSKYEHAARYPWLPVGPDVSTLAADPEPVNVPRPVNDAGLPVLPGQSQSPFDLEPK